MRRIDYRWCAMFFVECSWRGIRVVGVQRSPPDTGCSTSCFNRVVAVTEQLADGGQCASAQLAAGRGGGQHAARQLLGFYQFNGAMFTGLYVMTASETGYTDAQGSTGNTVLSLARARAVAAYLAANKVKIKVTIAGNGSLPSKTVSSQASRKVMITVSA